MPLQVIAIDRVESSAISTAKLKQEKLATVSSSKVLNYIDKEEFESKRFVERAPDQYCYNEADDDPNNDDELCSNPFNQCYKCDLNLLEKPKCIMATYEGSNVGSDLSDEEIFNLYCDECRLDIWGFLELHY